MKAEDHRRITRKAIELFNIFSGSELSAYLLQNSDRVEQGSDDADYHPFTTRITNWHFYPQNTTLKPKVFYLGGLLPLPVTPTSDHILKYRIKELRREFEKDNPARVEELIGRILHHIQDMSTPAHVVPVYHGPKLKDGFEEYSIEHSEAVIDDIVFDIAEYNAIKTEQLDEIIAIYHAAAQATLGMLYDDPDELFYILADGEEVVGGWRKFWLRYSELGEQCAEPPLENYEGFGCYSLFGQRYGESHITHNGVNYEIDPIHYQRLHQRIINKQVVDSVHALMVIDVMYSA